MLMCAMALGSAAQERSEIGVAYRYTYPQFPDTTNFRSADMMLLVNKNGAKYYNTMSEYCDSMTSTPEGKRRLREIQMAAWVTQTPEGITVDKSKGNAPDKRVFLYVFTDPAKDEVTVYDQFAKELRSYTEPYSEMTWSIVEDSVASVSGYECVMAEADYHGRHWKAWFAPEIPVPFGPWKLRGLPGLILRAEADGGFAFETTGIEARADEMTGIYQKDEYEKTDRRKALADEEYYRNNAEKLLKARYGSSIQIRPQDGGNKERPQYTSRYSIERDY